MQPIDVDALVAERDRLRELIDVIGRLSASGLPPDALAAAIVVDMQRLTRGIGAVLELVEGDELVYRHASGTIEPFVGLRLPRLGSLSGLCVDSGEAMYAADSEDDARVHRDAAQRVGARSMMVVPLPYAGRAIGVLKSVSDRVDAFDAVDEAALKLAACFVAGLLRRES